MVFNLLSNPFEGDFLGLAEHLACRYARNLIGRANQEAERLGEPPLPIDGEQITPEWFSTRFWTPELGAARMALARGITPESWPWLTGQMSLVAFLTGLLSSVEFEAPGSHPMAVAGHSLESTRFRVHGEGAQLVAEGAEGRVLAALTKFEPPDVAPVWAEAPDDVIRLGDAANATFSTAAWMSYWLPDAVQGQASAERQERRRLIERASDILSDCLPLHFLWVASLLRQVVPLEVNETGTQSQSFPLWPGQIHTSQATLVTVPIVLLHECSH